MYDVSISPGQQAYTYVEWNGAGAGTTTYTFANVTTGGYTSFTKSTPYPPQSGDPASFILEYHPWPQGSDNYVKFGTESFAWTDMQGTWGSGYFIEGGVNDNYSTGFNLNYQGQAKSWETSPDSDGGFNIYSEDAGC